jgi:hypothetical protein
MGILNKDVFQGRVPLSDGDQEKIYEVASIGGLYVEIGSLFGASACIAGLAGCYVYCIDPMEGYNFRGDPDPHDAHNTVPSPIIIQNNWVRQGLDIGKLHLYANYHPPWPREIDHAFDIGLIDGDHSMPHAWLDWNGMSLRVKQYLMFHDIHMRSVRSVWSQALGLSHLWEEYECETKKDSTMGVLKRIG